MNEIVNTLLLVGDKFMLEMKNNLFLLTVHVIHSQKNKERIEKFM